MAQPPNPGPLVGAMSHLFSISQGLQQMKQASSSAQLSGLSPNVLQVSLLASRSSQAGALSALLQAETWLPQG